VTRNKTDYTTDSIAPAIFCRIYDLATVICCYVYTFSLHTGPMSTQPGHPSVGRRNEYQPKGGDALWLGSEGRWFVCVGR